LASDATFHAKDRGELFVSDFDNYHPYQKANAAAFAQNGLLDVLGHGDNFNSLASAIYTGRIAAALGSPWFSEWQGLPNGATLPMPVNGAAQASDPSTPWHNYTAKGLKDGKLIIKAWTGGFFYMPPSVANAVFSLPGTGALTFNPKAIHWMSDLAILLQRGIVPGKP
jgi:hypothetical protein